jgi:hypothetical protein
MNCLKSVETVEQIAEPPFVDVVRNMWTASFLESSFLKDIPRIAKRIVIHTSDGTICGPFIEGNIKDIISNIIQAISNNVVVDPAENELVSRLLHDFNR